MSYINQNTPNSVSRAFYLQGIGFCEPHKALLKYYDVFDAIRKGWGNSVTSISSEQIERCFWEGEV